MSDTNDMRRDFEAWFSDEGLHPLSVKRSGNSYGLAQAAHAWVAWQAATERATAWQDVKDAERYRWLRKQEWFNGSLCVLRDPKKVLARGLALGADCPSGTRLDTAIDEAIRQGCAT